jgi:hypothetical protein
MPAPHAFYSKMLAERTASRNVFFFFFFFLFYFFFFYFIYLLSKRRQVDMYLSRGR